MFLSKTSNQRLYFIIEKQFSSSDGIDIFHLRIRCIQQNNTIDEKHL